MRVRRSSIHRLAGVVAGIVSVAAVTCLRLALSPLAGSDMALILYVIPVLIAAAVGGATAGTITTLLSLVVALPLVIGWQTFLASEFEWIRAAVFALEGVAISFVLHQLMQRTDQLRASAAELDRQRRLVERMALEDTLTGLGNRRAFENDVTRSIARAARDGIPLALIMADVDELKITNDRSGHAAGDALLVAIAHALKAACRAEDGAYRVGGDEFALLLANAGRLEFTAFDMRLAMHLEDVRTRHGGGTLSMGVAYAPEDALEASALMSRADLRMYADKERRRAANHAPASPEQPLDGTGT